MTREQLTNLIYEEVNKSDILKVVKNDKDFEKKVREIVADVVCDMFRVLWQHNSIFKVLGKK